MSSSVKRPCVIGSPCAATHRCSHPPSSSVLPPPGQCPALPCSARPSSTITITITHPFGFGAYTSQRSCRCTHHTPYLHYPTLVFLTTCTAPPAAANTRRRLPPHARRLDNISRLASLPQRLSLPTSSPRCCRELVFSPLLCHPATTSSSLISTPKSLPQLLLLALLLESFA